MSAGNPQDGGHTQPSSVNGGEEAVERARAIVRRTSERNEAGPVLSRRTFLIGATAVTAAGAWYALAQRERLEGTLLSAYEDVRGDQYVGGIRLDQGSIFGARVPMRAHGCAVDPADANRVIFFARRPGTCAFEFRRDTKQARTVFETGEGRHLAGHGVFSHDGALLYVPEHDYERVRGVLSVRDARTFNIVGEIDTLGIDPHELALSPDGRSLLVANGGILTHPRSFRRKLNIPTMDPSFCAIDASTGSCREQWRLPDHLLSIRHLAVSSDGSAAIGLQYEGEASQAPGIVALYRPGRGLQLLAAPKAERPRFKGYVASVAASEAHDVIAAACPYGAGVACWSLHGANYLGFIGASETYGLSPLADGTILASQRDGSAYALNESRLRSQFLNLDGAASIRWDDHWVSVGES